MLTIFSVVWLTQRLYGKSYTVSLGEQHMSSLISSSCCIYALVTWFGIGSDNGLALDRRQAITWSNADLLSMGPIWTNLNEIWIEIQNFSFMKMCLKIWAAKWWPFCPGWRWVNPLTCRCTARKAGCPKQIPIPAIAGEYNITWWCYDMETLSTSLALCVENPV